MTLVAAIEGGLGVETAETVTERTHQDPPGACEEVGVVQALQLPCPAHELHALGTPDEEVGDLVAHLQAIDAGARRNARVRGRREDPTGVATAAPQERQIDDGAAHQIDFPVSLQGLQREVQPRAGVEHEIVVQHPDISGPHPLERRLAAGGYATVERQANELDTGQLASDAAVVRHDDLQRGVQPPNALQQARQLARPLEGFHNGGDVGDTRRDR